MSVSSGEHLGPYEIQDRLGVGGMGEVFRAQDTRLGRSVAVKISAERFNERFEREARLIAALNHPNICTLYDVGPDYLVMELVEGPTLADRIAESPIPLEEALGLARQIAEALHAAHEKGIVHRDLKPVNIKLTPDGTVKVLDFGLATAVGAAAASGSTADSPTFTMGSTQVGTILGTAGYMAPEQARGRQVDKRADIWAYGVVLYEMLTGAKLFEAETVSDSLANVLTKNPDLDRVPFQVRRLLRSCLQKDPKQRLSDIGDAMLLLDDPPSTNITVSPTLTRFRWIWPAVVALLVLALGVEWWLSRRAAPASTETFRFEIPAPDKATLVENGVFSLSPDGRKIVFAAISNGDQKLWIRSMDSLEAHPLEGANLSRSSPPFWSPDSRFVAFESDNKLKKIDVNAGPPETVCDLPPNSIVGGSWGANNIILFGSNGGPIMQVPAGGGAPTPVTSLDRARKEIAHFYPVFLPDGKHFLYLRYSSNPPKSGLYAGALNTKSEQQSANALLDAQTRVSFVPAGGSQSGRLLFVRDGTLFGQSFNERRLSLEGEAKPILQQVGVSSNWLFPMFSATEKNLVFRGNASEELELTWLDRNGKVLGTVGEAGKYNVLALSPDGTRAAVGKRDSNGSDLWLFDMNGGAATRFTFSPSNSNPVWSPDGKRLAFSSNRGGKFALYEKVVNGAGGEDVLLQPTPGTALTDWSRDGRYTFFHGSGAIWALPVEGDRKPVPFLHSTFNPVGARLSPDGRYLAFRSEESGRQEIYVESFTPTPDAGSAATTSKWLVSRGGGAGMIHWRRDGKELYYLGLDGGMMAVPITPGPAFHAGTPELLFNVPASFMHNNAPGATGDVSPDGQRFLLLLPKGGERQEFTVVTNWASSLQK